MPDAVLSRAELYAKVWERPTIHVARTLGVSDVGLAKICSRYNVPRPPRGYWAKFQHGQRPARVPLPEPERDDRIDIRSALADLRQNPPVYMEGARDTRPTVRVALSDNLRGAHELVSRANAELGRADLDAAKILVVPERAALRLAVSKASLRRALLIMDALLRAIEESGHGVSAGPRATIDGVTLGFEITEQVETRQEPAPDADLSGRYAFGHSRFSEKREASGHLTLSISGIQWGEGLRRSWSDTEKQRLENRLDSFVAGLFAAAARAKQREERQRLEAERRREEAQRRADEARVLAEKRQLQKEEKARVEQLLRQSENWNRARRLRQYVEAVRAELGSGGSLQPGPEADAWIEWAMQQADRLDPLRPSPPSLLDEDLGPDEPSSPYGRGW